MLVLVCLWSMSSDAFWTSARRKFSRVRVLMSREMSLLWTVRTVCSCPYCQSSSQLAHVKPELTVSSFMLVCSLSKSSKLLPSAV